MNTSLNSHFHIVSCSAATIEEAGSILANCLGEHFSTYRGIPCSYAFDAQGDALEYAAEEAALEIGELSAEYPHLWFRVETRGGSHFSRRLIQFIQGGKIMDHFEMIGGDDAIHAMNDLLDGKEVTVECGIPFPGVAFEGEGVAHV